MAYKTDLTNQEWLLIEPHLIQKRGRPRIICRRLIMNAIRYVQKTGCQWHLLPKDFPPYKIVHEIYMKWVKSALIQRIHDALLLEVRKGLYQSERPSIGIIDSQSIKTIQKGENKGYDAGKKNKRKEASEVKLFDFTSKTNSEKGI